MSDYDEYVVGDLVTIGGVVCEVTRIVPGDPADEITVMPVNQDDRDRWESAAAKAFERCRVYTGYVRLD